MRSQDVDSIFTNIPLEATIDICANTLFHDTEKVEGLSKIEFNELLSFATKESCFISNGKIYKQVDGLTIGSSLGSTQASNFLYTLKISGYKTVRQTLNLMTTGDMLIISLFYLLH